MNVYYWKKSLIGNSLPQKVIHLELIWLQMAIILRLHHLVISAALNCQMPLFAVTVKTQNSKFATYRNVTAWYTLFSNMSNALIFVLLQATCHTLCQFACPQSINVALFFLPSLRPFTYIVPVIKPQQQWLNRGLLVFWRLNLFVWSGICWQQIRWR